MNQPQLYDDIALTRDFQEYGLKRGDVATFIDRVPHPAGGPEGLILEVTNAVGESIQIITVTRDDIECLNANEIWAVRQLAS